jgi:choline monooxygenase
MAKMLERHDVDLEAITRDVMPPTRWYLDPAILELEYERVFRRTWQWVGQTDQVATPGMYFACEVAGEPVVVLRAEDGSLRALSNVCLHRGALLAEGQGTVDRLRCRYHQWTYGLDGSLRGTPFFKRTPADAGCLPQFGVGTWGPLVFVNVDPQARPLADTLGDLPERFRHYRLDDVSCVNKVTLEGACNWKVHQENARECYHCPSIHPSFTTAYEVENFSVELFDLYSVSFVDQRCSTPPTETDGRTLVALARDIAGFRKTSPARAGLQGREETGYYYLHIFPNLSVLLGPDHVVVSRIMPDGVEGLTMERGWFFESASSPGAEAVQANVEFRLQNVREDLGICESVQKGLRSRYRRPNRYSPKEVAVHHFHSILKRFLGPAAVVGDR